MAAPSESMLDTRHAGSKLVADSDTHSPGSGRRRSMVGLVEIYIPLPCGGVRSSKMHECATAAQHQWNCHRHANTIADVTASVLDRRTGLNVSSRSCNWCIGG